jgi:beta-mannosidase
MRGTPACRVSSTNTVTDSPRRVDDQPLGYPGRPRIAGVSTHARHALDDRWELAAAPAGSVASPELLRVAEPSLVWRTAIVPGTVASALRAQGALGDLELAPDFDASDWWYRRHFARDEYSHIGVGGRDVLCFDGLATLADVWVNGQLVLTSENMFVGHEVDVTSLLVDENEIAIRFRSLRTALQARKPRPRWRTKLVEHQQLRWYRATLLGRMPGWSPPVRAVGPWRSVRLEHRAALELTSGDVDARATPLGGVVDVAIVLSSLEGTGVRAAEIVVGEWRGALHVAADSPGVRITGSLECYRAEHWWPHTHGTPAVYPARLDIATDAGMVRVELGTIAFRDVELDLANDGFAFVVNGERVFCRGACWTTPDIISLGGSEPAYRHWLTLARDAGMNMIRIGGTMVYEADCFYDLCDELGIMVWQDFMFANMDYPAGDAAFAAAVREEAEAVVARLRRHPSVVLYCGNSEVEQQAAMLGLEPALWSNAIFREVLPAACEAGAPGVRYWPSSPSGGALPFHADAGVAHYYGVGAYLRPLDDARRSNVRFTSECLGFSNIPEPESVDALLPNGEAPVHHPRWKARVPRDHGAGWDFEDVRDHYLQQLFAVDPVRLRYADRDRYLALSRVVTGEVMAQTIGEWRRGASACNGALLWFLQDLWLGAGWGVIDSAGRPKAAYYAVKRAMQSVAVAITDEGANGLRVSVTNDRAVPLDAELSIALVRGASTTVASAISAHAIPAHATAAVDFDALLGRFYDSAYAYRFGPPGHDVAVATLRDARGHFVSEAFHFPLGLPSVVADESGLSCEARAISPGGVEITLAADRFVQSLYLDCGEFRADDNYFHMAPGARRTVIARAARPDAAFNGFAQPLNAREGVRIALVAASAEHARGARA